MLQLVILRYAAILRSRMDATELQIFEPRFFRELHRQHIYAASKEIRGPNQHRRYCDFTGKIGRKPATFALRIPHILNYPKYPQYHSQAHPTMALK